MLVTLHVYRHCQSHILQKSLQPNIKFYRFPRIHTFSESFAASLIAVTSWISDSDSDKVSMSDLDTTGTTDQSVILRKSERNYFSI